MLVVALDQLAELGQAPARVPHLERRDAVLKRLNILRRGVDLRPLQKLRNAHHGARGQNADDRDRDQDFDEGEARAHALDRHVFDLFARFHCLPPFMM